MKAWLDDNFEMPDKMVALLIRFLDQNNGELSNRATNLGKESFIMFPPHQPHPEPALQSSLLS